MRQGELINIPLMFQNANGVHAATALITARVCICDACDEHHVHTEYGVMSVKVLISAVRLYNENPEVLRI